MNVESIRIHLIKNDQKFVFREALEFAKFSRENYLYVSSFKMMKTSLKETKETVYFKSKTSRFKINSIGF